MSKKEYDVFISYSTKDDSLAQIIYNSFCDHNLKVCLAPKEFVPGNDFTAEIENSINGSRLVFLLFTRNAYDSDYVKDEVTVARNNGIPIIALKMQDIILSDGWSILLARPHWLHAIGVSEESIKEISLNAITNKLDIIANEKDTNNTYIKTASYLEQGDKIALDELQLLAKKSKNEFLESNAQKYNPDSYIKRESFQSFYANSENKSLIVLLGEAGMGKTNETCNLVNTNFKNEICFAFNSQSLGQSIEDILYETLTQYDYGLRSKDLKSILFKIDFISQATKSKVYFLFDAINEAFSYPLRDKRIGNFPMLQLMKDIKDYLLDESYSNIRVIISCRSSQYEHLKQKIGSELKLDINNVPTFTLEKYTNSEIKEIFAIYKKEYQLETSIEEFTSPGFREIRNNLSSPLFFKLFVKLFQGKSFPEHISNYDFVVVVRKLLSENLYDSNFNAYELLLRITQWMRINYEDSIDVNLILPTNDPELLSIKKQLITPEGKISSTFDILFSDNYLKYSDGQIRFVYEKMQEALFEITFLNEHNNNLIESSKYKEILKNNPKYDVVSFTYLSNSSISNYLKNDNIGAINDIVIDDDGQMQILAQLILSKLCYKGYNNQSYRILEQMISSEKPLVIESALKTISILFNEFETVSEYELARKKGTTPINFFLQIFNSTQNDEILNTAGLQLYNVTLQHQHLSGVILTDLFYSLLNNRSININALMQIGLLSCIVSIDTLVCEDQSVEERKKFVQQNIIKYWESIVEKIFRSNSKISHPGFPKSSAIISIIPAFLRNLFLGIGIRVAMMKYFTIQTDYTNNLKEYENYWKSVALKGKNLKWSKEKFCEIADLFDVNNIMEVDQVSDIVEAYKTGDVFSYLMIERMLIRRGIENWTEVGEISRKILSLTETDTKYIDYIQMSQCYVLFHIVDKSKNKVWTEEIEGEAFLLLEETAYNWSLRTYGRFKTPYIEHVNTSYGVYKQFVLNWYIVAACKRNKGDEYTIKHIPMIVNLINELMKSRNIDKDLLLYIVENIVIAATNLGKINTSLALYEYLVKNIGTEHHIKILNDNNNVLIEEYKNTSIDEYFIRILNTMKAFFPDQTEKFEAENLTMLAENKNYLAQEILKKSQVITKTEETLASLLTSRFGNFFVWGLGDNDIREFIVYTLKTSKNKRSSKDWALYCLQYTVKKLVGYKL